MKKLFYFLFFLGIVSCSTSSDDTLGDQQNIADLEPNKAFVHYMESPKVSSLQPSWYYTFTYENGRLMKMIGKFVKSESIWSPDSFYSDSFTTLSYHSNKIEVKFSDNTYYTIVYTMENDRPKKAELYNQFNELITLKTYTYESGKIKIYSKTYNSLETFYTYYLDSSNNLIKSEKLEKSGGLDKSLTTTTYSNFDTAKNPFKKLYLLNDNFYEKSLSKNNYRKINYTIQDLQNPEYLPGSGNAEWTYQYDTSGQIVLYHPL